MTRPPPLVHKSQILATYRALCTYRGVYGHHSGCLLSPHAWHGEVELLFLEECLEIPVAKDTAR